MRNRTATPCKTTQRTALNGQRTNTIIGLSERIWGPDFEKPFCVSYYHPFGNGVRMSTQWKTDTGERPLWAAIYRLFKSSPHLGLSSFPLLNMLGFVPPPSAAHNERVSAHRHLLASSSFGHCSALSPTAGDSYVGTDHASTKDYNNRNTRLCPPMLEH